MKRFMSVAFCVLWIMQSACVAGLWKSRDKVEELSAATYASSRTTASSTGEASHTIRLHIMADASYRREQLRWRERIESQIEAASREMRAQFGVDLEISAIQEWDHDPGTAPLEQVLSDLRDARAVTNSEDRVVGFTSSLPTPSSQHHQLGVAYELGEHLVLRGMQDHAERDVIERTLEIHQRHESDAIYRSRLEHKRTTVLIHEIGHSFGAMHVKSRGQIMSPIYDHKTHHFSRINAALLEDAFALDRVHRGQPHATWQRAFLDALRERRANEDSLLAEIPASDLDHLLEVSHVEASEEHLSLDAVSAAMERKEFAEAWEKLEPQLDGDASPRVVAMACVIQANLESDDLQPIKQWCGQVVESKVEMSAYASLMLALRLSTSEPLLAIEYSKTYEELLREGKDATAERWLYLASIYQSCGALSHAERVTALAGMTRTASDLRDEIVTRRHHMSLFEVPADDEPVIYQALMRLEPTLQEQDPDAHVAALSQLEALAPDAPPTIVARCRVAVARRDSPEVKKQCKRAAKQVPQSAMALWGLGIAQMVERKDARGIATFERAIALAPALSSPWSALAHHYTVEKKQEELDALRARYEAQFGQAPSW